MTIINICFFDGSPESADIIVDGLNRLSAVDWSLVVVRNNTDAETLVEYAGTKRKFDYCKIENRKYEILLARLMIEMKNIRRMDSESEFKIAISTAKGMEAFVCYPLTMMFGATVYTNDEDEFGMDNLRGMSELDRTKIEILKKIDTMGIMNAYQLVDSGIGIKYRACRNALGSLEKAGLIECVDPKEIDSRTLTVIETGKRGPKSVLYRLTETGKLAKGLIEIETNQTR